MSELKETKRLSVRLSERETRMRCAAALLIGARLKKMRERLGIGQGDVAAVLGLKGRGTVSNWERGISYPPADALSALAEMYNIDMNWILTGQGPMLRGVFDPNAVSHDPAAPICGCNEMASCVNTTDYVLIPFFESGILCDRQGEIVYNVVPDHVPFKTTWINGLLGDRVPTLDKLVLIRVTGMTMIPTINHNDVALVDTSDMERNSIVNGKIYLIQSPNGEISIRRLALIESSASSTRILCLCDNSAAFQPYQFEIEPGKQIRHHVLGRVLWCGRQVD